MNAIDLLREVLIADLPTVAQVISGEHTPATDEVVLVVHRKGEWVAVGPFLTKDIEWGRLLPTDRVLPG